MTENMNESGAEKASASDVFIAFKNYLMEELSGFKPEIHQVNFLNSLFDTLRH